MKVVNEVEKLLKFFGYDPSEFRIEHYPKKRLTFATASLKMMIDPDPLGRGVIRYINREKKPYLIVWGGQTSIARYGLAVLIAHELSHYRLITEHPEYYLMDIDQHKLPEFKRYEEEYLKMIEEVVRREVENENIKG